MNNSSPLLTVQTSFSTWDTRKRAWFPKGRYLKVPVPESVGGSKEERRSFTVFAAISTALKKGFYIQFDQSTNKWGFNGFLENLALEIKDEYVGSLPVMVLGKLFSPIANMAFFAPADNHPAHKSNDVQNTLYQYYQPEPFPPYSCEVSLPLL